MSDFDLFWSRYPRRVGKLAAMKAYQRALLMATPDEIVAGVETYRQHLPEDVKFVPHAATWLNQGRWMDEYDALPQPERQPTKPAHQPYVPLRLRVSNE